MTVSSGKQYLLTFGTLLGRTRTLRIIHADDSLTDTQVRNSMQSLVASAAFRGTGGQISNARSAAIIETHITPIDLPV